MANQSLVRYVNARRVVTLLRIEGPSSRADIARRLSLTRSTITNVVDDLLRRKLLIEMPQQKTEGRRELGRPGINVRLNPAGAYFLGAEIDVGVVRFALLDLAGNVAETRMVDAETTRPEDAVERIADVHAALEQRPKHRGRIRALGLTVPGLVRSDGLVVHLPVLGWKNVKLLQLAAAQIDTPLFIENNTNAAAFGEVYTHPGPNRDFIVYLKLGIGCGGAAIMNGRLMRGGRGTAAEFGHMRVADTGPLCSCGRRGCLESFVNLAALAAGFAPGQKFEMSELVALSAKVAKAERAGVPRAREIVESITAHLVTGLVSLTNIFNPAEIVLGGLMRPLFAPHMPKLAQGVRSGIVPGMAVPQLRLSAGEEFECAIGAASIAHHESFDVSNIELEVIESVEQYAHTF
jgi:predicted NBD/HSP70 family sugar kinase